MYADKASVNNYHYKVQDGKRTLQGAMAAISHDRAYEKVSEKFAQATMIEISGEDNIHAKNLMAGDLCIMSKEKVIAGPYQVYMTPKGKVELLLDKGGKRRDACWNEYTAIHVKRVRTWLREE